MSQAPDATGSEGETLSVTADIENTGSTQETKTVQLVVDDGVGVVDSGSLTIAAGATVTTQLRWDTQVGDAGTYTVTVETPDFGDNRLVEVTLGDVEPTITSTNSPVKPGETLDVTADIENTGSASQTTDVELVVDGSVRDTVSGLSLAAGATKTRTLSWATSSSQTAQAYTASVQTDDASDSETVAVEAIIDDFERGDLSPYTDNSTGDGVAEVVQSPVKQGSHALRLYEGVDEVEIISMSGLPNYPSQGDTFEYYYRYDNQAIGAFHFGVQSTSFNDKYAIRARGDKDEFVLFGGNDSERKSVSLSTNEWYRIEVDWQTDGTITATLYDKTETQISQVSITDSTYSSGGIAFDGFTGTSSTDGWFFDDVKII